MEQIIFTKEQLLEELGIVENTLRAMIEHNGFPTRARCARSCSGWCRR
ncbi:hypothetical protein G7047_00075 [Diaphorobacter sp. HDW4A]|nr:hypothetical protein [Diaphorobacter sp. HDW4A]QIL78492.1 hypothetical protein G7047_00075 [Diaphorobacter sp. HDW4A]